MTVSNPGLDDAVLYRLKFARRLPPSLSALTGPIRGVIELPLHVAWSGLRAFDLDQPRQRMGLYRTVLAEGTREDLCRFLNAELLASLWPVLRTLAGPSVRDVWEEAFPQLRELAAAWRCRNCTHGSSPTCSRSDPSTPWS